MTEQVFAYVGFSSCCGAPCVDRLEGDSIGAAVAGENARHAAPGPHGLAVDGVCDSEGGARRPAEVLDDVMDAVLAEFHIGTHSIEKMKAIRAK